jgi:hypothetical protein
VKRFRFRLESVLKWRLLQLELEEAKLQGLFTELQALGARREALAAGRADSERAVLALAVIEAQQLEALDAHRRWVTAERERLARQAADCATRIASQREHVRKAEQNLRLLEKVKERRLAEWSRALDKEYETLAAEGFLLRWQRAE